MAKSLGGILQQLKMCTKIEVGRLKWTGFSEKHCFYQFLLWVLILQILLKIFYWNTHLQHWWNISYISHGIIFFDNFTFDVQLCKLQSKLHSTDETDPGLHNSFKKIPHFWSVYFFNATIIAVLLQFFSSFPEMFTIF